MKVHWSTKAKRSLARVEGATANMSAGDVRTMLLNREMERIAPKPVEDVPQSPPNPVAVIRAELAAKRYDMRAVSRNRSPWAMEMKHKMLDFHDLWAQGKMTKAEVWKREAAVLKDYVLKHDKPISRAEWNRRTEIYAKEDEAVRANKARQRALQMKNAPENERILREAIEKHRREKVPK
jgi:hypothetical protein